MTFGFLFGSCARNTRAHSIGVSVSETNPETMIATDTVTANSQEHAPNDAAHQAARMNTAISENVIEMIVKPISRAPSAPPQTAACRARCGRTMFSSMTMASSTTKRPKASVQQRHVVDG